MSLKEFHPFRQEGEIYLFNVATMTPYRISAPVARLVDQAASSFGGGLLSEQTMEELKKLDLVVGIDRPPVPAAEPAADEAKPATGVATARHAVGNIALFVAQECNMACVYCYGQGGEYAEKGMMDAATAFKAVDWLMENAGGFESVNVGFFGGDNLPECQRCWARHACGGGCFYESKAARGDIHLPDPSHCQATKALMEMAIPLYLQLDDADKAYVRDSLKRQLEDQIP